jgi:hypothetical protein
VKGGEETIERNPGSCARRSDDTDASCRTLARAPVPSASLPGPQSLRPAPSLSGRLTRRTRGFAARSDYAPPAGFAGHRIQGRRKGDPRPTDQPTVRSHLKYELAHIKCLARPVTEDHFRPPWTQRPARRARGTLGHSEPGAENGHSERRALPPPSWRPGPRSGPVSKALAPR